MIYYIIDLILVSATMFLFVLVVEHCLFDSFIVKYNVGHSKFIFSFLEKISSFKIYFGLQKYLYYVAYFCSHFAGQICWRRVYATPPVLPHVRSCFYLLLLLDLLFYNIIKTQLTQSQ